MKQESGIRYGILIAMFQQV